MRYSNLPSLIIVKNSNGAIVRAYGTSTQAGRELCERELPGIKNGTAWIGEHQLRWIGRTKPFLDSIYLPASCRKGAV